MPFFMKQLIEHGIPVWIANKPAMAHNKIMIIDGTEVITGSFNFTDSAQKKKCRKCSFDF